jgi:predicted dehydrogenase
MSIGLAVIGVGYWGPNLVRTAVATSALELKWLCGLDEVRARDVLGRYTTVQELSQLDSLDAVVAAVERNRG